MAGELPTRSLGIRWADIVALVQAYASNNITEEHFAAAVRAKLKPSGGWADGDLAQAVQALLRRVGGFAHNNQAADVSTRQVSLAGYQLVNGVIVSVRFANDVPAGAKLQISGDNGSTYTAAKDIYLGVAPIGSAAGYPVAAPAADFAPVQQPVAQPQFNGVGGTPCSSNTSPNVQ